MARTYVDINLYTMLKLGWAFGVAITACVLSFVLWNGLRLIFPKLSEMSILENNCMQSTASAAGYSTGATVGLALAHCS
ncbi:MAG: OPT/YSL family transporter [Candidatus Obscuribacter sp.]|nr:OPT/YSL family transporter [Candidatus Obscuribacter sp.]